MKQKGRDNITTFCFEEELADSIIQRNLCNGIRKWHEQKKNQGNKGYPKIFREVIR